MAAIAYPHTSDPTVPTLRLVPALPSQAVYWRRRVAVALAVLLLLFVAVQVATLLRAAPDAVTVRAGSTTAATGYVLVNEPAAYGSSGTPLPDRAVYVVRPGDTLWSISRAVSPHDDVTATASRLADLNGSSALQVGQRLRLN